MDSVEQKKAAKEFAERWKGHGQEKQEAQKFWMDLLHDVFGVEHASDAIEFEKPTAKGSIDAYIHDTKVLIEQKTLGTDMKDKEPRQGKMVTPYEQARDYASLLGADEAPRYIVLCNFEDFWIADTKNPPKYDYKKKEYYTNFEVLHLKDLEKDYKRLEFLVTEREVNIQKEVEVSLKAGELVGIIYNLLLNQYENKEDPEVQKSLNKLCVRLVFCLYAEDAGIFGRHDMFHDYLDAHKTDARTALQKLFKILNTKEENRDPYEDTDLLEFPYVNGGLFADENVIIPRLTDDIVDSILEKAARGFDWSVISPVVFGACFESSLNPETRRSGGMHYTPVSDIHKLIDPLFLDDLEAEYERISHEKVLTKRTEQLKAFQNKLASLTFFDPACGSGNFLTETYIALRTLENKVINDIWMAHTGIKGQMALAQVQKNPIKVSIGQFYGIEVNDFAVTVAKTALWIAESQMMQKTEELLSMHIDFLPLKTNAFVHEGNALTTDWNEILPAEQDTYLLGNPPFVGATFCTSKQKKEIVDIVGKIKLSNSIDYVGGWYYKAAAYIQRNPAIKGAFVSTNSITQGEQVYPLWNGLLNKYHLHIDFAYRTFVWNSEATSKAHVHCVIIGFSLMPSFDKKRIFDGDKVTEVKNISPYLIDAPDILVASRPTPICKVPRMYLGNKPSDGGNLILSSEERDEMLKKEPALEKFIKKYTGSVEYINGKERYCLWLTDATPSELSSSHILSERLKKVRDMRLKSSAKPTREKADTPQLFFFISQPKTDYLLIPNTSSESRDYVPIGFLSPDVIASNSTTIVADATPYHFGVMTSNVHMNWMRTVCGRMKSDYRYSNAIVYNTFPWPNPTEQQRAKITATAQEILRVREEHKNDTLAALYNPISMPTDLRKAHRDNDKAVMEAYGFADDMTSEEQAAALLRMYKNLTEA